MKKLAINRHGIGAVQQFKPMTPASVYRKRRSPMNRHNRRMILLAAVAVLAGLALAGPVLAGPPANAHYTFTTIDFPGAAGTEILGFSTRTMVGDFVDAEGNNHGWLRSAQSGNFLQFDVPGAWF